MGSDPGGSASASRPRSATMRHRLSAVPLSESWTAKAPLAVELFWMASSFPLLTLRILYVPSPWSSSVHRWSAVPLSAHCRTARVVGGGHVLNAEHLAAVDVAEPDRAAVGDHFPVVVGGAGVGPLQRAPTVGRGHVLDAQHEAAADVDEAVRCRRCRWPCRPSRRCS